MLRKAVEAVMGTSLIYPSVVPDVPRLCGIYFLMRGKKVVYVGQSIDIVSRIAKHSDEAAGLITSTEPKLFDSAQYIECEQENLDYLESAFICELNPEYNRDCGPAGSVDGKQRKRILWDRSRWAGQVDVDAEVGFRAKCVRWREEEKLGTRKITDHRISAEDHHVLISECVKVAIELLTNTDEESVGVRDLRARCFSRLDYLGFRTDSLGEMGPTRFVRILRDSGRFWFSDDMSTICLISSSVRS